MLRFLLLFVSLSRLVFAQNAPEELLKVYKNSHQFNRMDSLNEVLKNKDYLFYKAVYANVTNDPKTSLKLLRSPENDHLKETFEYTKLLNDNAVKTFDYRLANLTAMQMTTKFNGHFTHAELMEEINNQRIWEGLVQTPQQTVSRFQTVSLPIKKDGAGLLTTPVRNKNYSVDFVFDTGAGLNCITETQARQLGLKILPMSRVEVKSFTGQMNRVKVGVAESFSIGEITVRNAVFLIYPDEAFTFADGQYVINGIIGFPIAKELGTLTIEKHQITASQDPVPFEGPKNFFIDGLRGIVMFEFQDQLLPANFDSGASSSLFTKAFYETFKDYVDAESESGHVKSAGAGAQVVVKDVKILSYETITLGNAEVELPELTVDIKNYGVHGKVNFANIGQDILSQFKKVTLSFNHNYLLLQD
jgi:hypothetical protein